MVQPAPLFVQIPAISDHFVRHPNLRKCPLLTFHMALDGAGTSTQRWEWAAPMLQRYKGCAGTAGGDAATRRRAPPARECTSGFAEARRAGRGGETAEGAPPGWTLGLLCWGLGVGSLPPTPVSLTNCICVIVRNPPWATRRHKTCTPQRAPCSARPCGPKTNRCYIRRMIVLSEGHANRW